MYDHLHSQLPFVRPPAQPASADPAARPPTQPAALWVSVGSASSVSGADPESCCLCAVASTDALGRSHPEKGQILPVSPHECSQTKSHHLLPRTLRVRPPRNCETSAPAPFLQAQNATRTANSTAICSANCTASFTAGLITSLHRYGLATAPLPPLQIFQILGKVKTVFTKGCRIIC